MPNVLLINIIGLIVFLGVAVLCSRNRKNIQWKSILILVILNLFLAWFFIYFDWGRNGVKGAANGIAWVIESRASGYRIRFRQFHIWKANGYGCKCPVSYLTYRTFI